MSVTLGALVIAISTEFSVLLSERYRQEREAGHAPAEALTRTYRSTGAAVLASGATAIAGLRGARRLRHPHAARLRLRDRHRPHRLAARRPRRAPRGARAGRAGRTGDGAPSQPPAAPPGARHVSGPPQAPPPARPPGVSRYTWFIGVVAFLLIVLVTINAVDDQGVAARRARAASAKLVPFAAPRADAPAREGGDEDANLNSETACRRPRPRDPQHLRAVRARPGRARAVPDRRVALRGGARPVRPRRAAPARRAVRGGRQPRRARGPERRGATTSRSAGTATAAWRPATAWSAARRSRSPTRAGRWCETTRQRADRRRARRDGRSACGDERAGARAGVGRRPTCRPSSPSCGCGRSRRQARPGRSTPGLRERLKALSSRFYGAQAVQLRTDPIPHAYRVFYRHVGLDPDTERTPVEAAVVNRLLHGGFRSRGLVEDALLVAVAETGVPLWALDEATLDGAIGIRMAGGRRVARARRVRVRRAARPPRRRRPDLAGRRAVRRSGDRPRAGGGHRGAAHLRRPGRRRAGDPRRGGVLVGVRSARQCALSGLPCAAMALLEEHRGLAFPRSVDETAARRELRASDRRSRASARRRARHRVPAHDRRRAGPGPLRARGSSGSATSRPSATRCGAKLREARAALEERGAAYRGQPRPARAHAARAQALQVRPPAPRPTWTWAAAAPTRCARAWASSGCSWAGGTSSSAPAAR